MSRELDTSSRFRVPFLTVGFFAAAALAAAAARAFWVRLTVIAVSGRGVHCARVSCVDSVQKWIFFGEDRALSELSLVDSSSLLRCAQCWTNVVKLYFASRAIVSVIVSVEFRLRNTVARMQCRTGFQAPCSVTACSDLRGRNENDRYQHRYQRRYQHMPPQKSVYVHNRRASSWLCSWRGTDVCARRAQLHYRSQHNGHLLCARRFAPIRNCLCSTITTFPPLLGFATRQGTAGASLHAPANPVRKSEAPSNTTHHHHRHTHTHTHAQAKHTRTPSASDLLRPGRPYERSGSPSHESAHTLMDVALGRTLPGERPGERPGPSGGGLRRKVPGLPVTVGEGARPRRYM